MPGLGSKERDPSCLHMGICGSALRSVAGIGGLPVGVVDAPQAPLDGTHREDMEPFRVGRNKSLEIPIPEDEAENTGAAVADGVEHLLHRHAAVPGVEPFILEQVRDNVKDDLLRGCDNKGSGLVCGAGVIGLDQVRIVHSHPL
jgi:hypothetical protein